MKSVTSFCQAQTLLLSSLLFLHPNLAKAGTMGDNQEFSSSFLSSYLISLSVGPVWQDTGKSQTILLAPNIEKTYTSSSSSQTLTEGELLLGVHFWQENAIQGQFGIALATASSASRSGEIWDDASPEFNNYNYSYKISHEQVTAKAKFLLNTDYTFLNANLLPWVNVGLGAGWNKASQFNNVPTIPEAIVNPNFSNNTQSSFVYSVGAGIQFQLNLHWQAGLGYEFSDWGKSQLGRAPGQTLNSGLSLSHLYTQGALFNLSYLA